MAIFGKPRHYYAAFSFLLAMNDDDAGITVESVFNDPFSSDIWVSRGHEVDEPTLISRFEAEARDQPLKPPRPRVWMIPRKSGGATWRSIMLSFESVDSKPLALDVHDDDRAMEWVRLVNGSTIITDCPIADLPPAIRTPRL